MGMDFKVDELEELAKRFKDVGDDARRKKEEVDDSVRYEYYSKIWILCRHIEAYLVELLEHKKKGELWGVEGWDEKT